MAYKELSKERKRLQEEGKLPEWYTTAAWQMFKAKYAVEGEEEGVRARFKTIAKCLSRFFKEDAEKWENKFYNLMWKGWVSCSSPMLANTGTDRGCSVSCSGGYIQDSVDGFYTASHEIALLTKQGFGTSSYLGDIRPRGSIISTGGKASGSLPVLKNIVQVTRDVSQGNIRRGAWAGYLPIDHDDFWEWVNYVHKQPDDVNIGWNISQSFIEKLNAGEQEAVSRYKKTLKVKVETGKGYYFFIDKVNESNPPEYKEHNLSVKASNLCTEITLHSDHDHTFTCVLLSMNLCKWDEWKDTNAVYDATVLLDCLAEDFIEKAKNIRGLEKAVRFTERSRALGLGALGFHSYLQSKMIPIEDLEAHFINTQMFKRIKNEALRASKDMALWWGEPDWCKGFGRRNTHLLAVAPNMSSAVLMGGISQGIEPFVANVFNQNSAAGELERINPECLKLLKVKDRYTPEVIDSIINHKGSVQHLEWLDETEKLVFKTAYEIDQKALLRLASARQQYICQAQSINLFFAADEDEEYISEVHKMAFLDKNIKSLYYLRTLAGVQASKECIACEG